MVSAPVISLPKGGGAIRGMGEKFAANPVTGTGSMNVPIATSPGRSGFGPQLSLAYDSGCRQRPIRLRLEPLTASVTQQDRQGLPQYGDAGRIRRIPLSGVEDWVPVLVGNARRVGAPSGRSAASIGGQRLSAGSGLSPPSSAGRLPASSGGCNGLDPRETSLALHFQTTTSPPGTVERQKAVWPDPKRCEPHLSWLVCRVYDGKGDLRHLRLRKGEMR